MNKFILLILTVIGTITAFSQSNHNDPDSVTKKRSAFFVSYMKNTFPDFKLTDGEYLFILSTGCVNCNFAVYNHLLTHPESVRGKYKAILISQATLEKLPEEFLTIDNNILCDKTNKLDRMSFGISSVSVLKIKNKMIVASKSMTVDDVQNGIDTFFEKM